MITLKVDLRKPDFEVIKKASDILKKGGIIVYPTDTAYGLGGNALDEKAVKKIYAIKGRDYSKPTHVIVRDKKMIESLTFTNNSSDILYEKFMPGPLTIILRKKDHVPNLLTAKLPTLGVRIPNSKVTLQISELLDFPYTTPSANKTGGVTPYSIDDIKNELDLEKVDLLIDGGNLPRVAASTIINLTTIPPKLVRGGPVTKNELEKTLSLSVVS